ncbi:MAG: phosphatidate cytidylyltransferase [Christensenellaceae bacterium]|jgi:phosphatidate cytidylyltransferase|nr:phosphatidate cytidylyltransferase [Christensenellaceae bacterium]
MKKTVTGLSLLVVLLGFIFLTKISQFFFDAALLLLLVLAVCEMCKLAKQKGYNVTVVPLMIITAIIYPAIYFFDLIGFFATGAFGFILIFSFYIFDQKIKFEDFLFSLLIEVYPALLISLGFLMIHADFGEHEVGMIPLLLAASAAMCADTFAYYFGSLIKGPKIFPSISPKKTYSGSIAGLFGGAAGALLVYLLFEHLKLPLNMPFTVSETFKYPILFYSLIGVGIAVVSAIGDLGASRIKRSLEIKDYSKILGSHGGVMDRIDSILFSFVFMAITLYFIL